MHGVFANHPCWNSPFFNKSLEPLPIPSDPRFHNLVMPKWLTPQSSIKSSAGLPIDLEGPSCDRARLHSRIEYVGQRVSDRAPLFFTRASVAGKMTKLAAHMKNTVGTKVVAGFGVAFDDEGSGPVGKVHRSISPTGTPFVS